MDLVVGRAEVLVVVGLVVVVVRLGVEEVGTSELGCVAPAPAAVGEVLDLPEVVDVEVEVGLPVEEKSSVVSSVGGVVGRYQNDISIK